MIEQDAHLPIDPPSARGFGLIVGTVICLIGLHPLALGREAWPWPVALGLSLVLLGLVAPKLLTVPNLIWFRFGLILGSLVANLLMTLVFMLIVTPTGILMRRVRRNYLGLGAEDGLQTYWVSRDSDPITPESLRNQF